MAFTIFNSKNWLSNLEIIGTKLAVVPAGDDRLFALRPETIFAYFVMVIKSKK